MPVVTTSTSPPCTKKAYITCLREKPPQRGTLTRLTSIIVKRDSYFTAAYIQFSHKSRNQRPAFVLGM